MKINTLSVTEQLLILLLGIVKRPIPSKLHIQKELFILTRIYPRLNEVLNYQPYLKGPFSREVQDTLEDLIQRQIITYINRGYTLTERGWELFHKIVNQLRKKELLDNLRKIRETYDRFGTDELLLLMYLTYSDYTVESEELNKILKRSAEILENLLRKGYITRRRYEELLVKVKELEKLLREKTQR